MGLPASQKLLVLRLRVYVCADFHAHTSYMLSRGRPEPRLATLLCRPIGKNGYLAVQEYKPVVHRLRLSASP